MTQQSDHLGLLLLLADLLLHLLHLKVVLGHRDEVAKQGVDKKSDPDCNWVATEASARVGGRPMRTAYSADLRSSTHLSLSSFWSIIVWREGWIGY